MTVIREKFFRQADKFFLAVIIFLFIISLALAGWYGTWAEAFAIGLPAVIVPFIISRIAPARRITRVTVAMALMIFSALHIHQAHGLIEMHFGIFVSLALLLYYRDVLPILTAAATIAVHHLLFNYLQEQGNPVWIFEFHTGISIVLLHAAFVIIESAALIYLAHKSWQEFLQNEELVSIGQHISNGDVIDLTYRVEQPKGELTPAFNDFFALVGDIVAQVSQLSEQIDELGRGFADATQQMSDGARRQFRETEQIATATHEMSASMQDINHHSHLASDIAETADQTGKDSEQSVTRARNTISSLAESIAHASDVIRKLDSESNNIGSVLQVIQGIAEQTNLLALNAAIEAARAGEQGRGFAVVADEVRTLASRTHESTEEIQQMIERLQKESSQAVKVMTTSQEGVSSSVEQISQSADNLLKMKNAVTEMRDMNHHIAQAIDEQNNAIAEVNNNLTVIRDISESTSSQAQASAGRSGHLVAMASDLRGLLMKLRA